MIKHNLVEIFMEYINMPRLMIQVREVSVCIVFGEGVIQAYTETMFGQKLENANYQCVRKFT